MGYSHEIEALERWIYQIAGLHSYRLSSQPPEVARPVVLWTAPNRRKGQNLDRYHYSYRNTQHAILYVEDLTQLATLTEQLEEDLEERCNELPMYADGTAGASQIGRLRQVQLDMNTADTTDVGFSIRYEVYYSRTKPEAAPAATTVTNTRE